LGERTFILLLNFRVIERGHAGGITSRPVLQQRLKASPWKKKKQRKIQKRTQRHTRKRLRRVQKERKKKERKTHTGET
jgi:hypothetical protein